jgi:hypothetical protein
MEKTLDSFEFIEDDNDFVFLNNDGNQIRLQKIPKHKNNQPLLRDEYFKLLHRTKVNTTQLNKLFENLEKNKDEINTEKHELWLNALNCVIKCVSTVIHQGSELLPVETNRN